VVLFFNRVNPVSISETLITPWPDRPWYYYVAERYRYNLLSVLQELSRLGQRKNWFVLGGGLSLLIHGRLAHQVMWDVDLIFRDRIAFYQFMGVKKDENLRIVDLDEKFGETSEVFSFHTAWGFDCHWINVDYLYRDLWFSFHYDTIVKKGEHMEEVKFGGSTFQLCLPVAYPWDIFVEKVMSPRFAEDFELRNDLSYDIRHVLILYQQERGNPAFWEYLRRRAEDYGLLKELKSRLLSLLEKRGELGYEHIRILPEVWDRIQSW